MSIKAVIFDLDGVIVSTDEFHYQGWQLGRRGTHLFRPRDQQPAPRRRALGSLAILLERAARQYTEEEKRELAARKNRYYRKLLESLTPADVLPGVEPTLRELRALGVKLAMASSSRNAGTILAKIGMADAFDACVDGNDIAHSKPHPEVFLKAAARLARRLRNALWLRTPRRAWTPGWPAA